jgi:hypothetical protein
MKNIAFVSLEAEPKAVSRLDEDEEIEVEEIADDEPI